MSTISVGFGFRASIRLAHLLGIVSSDSHCEARDGRYLIYSVRPTRSWDLPLQGLCQVALYLVANNAHGKIAHTATLSEPDTADKRQHSYVLECCAA